MTKIEWTDATWNPIVGCSVVSPGCTNCYAMKMAARIEAMRQGTWRQQLPAGDAIPGGPYTGLTQQSKAGPVWTGKVTLAGEEKLTEPLRRKKPTMYFVNSMSDLFHESVPDEWIDRIFAVMALAPQHTFQVLTKRAKRMREYMLGAEYNGGRVSAIICELMGPLCEDGSPLADDIWDLMERARDKITEPLAERWPLPNVWLGVSAEDQTRADERIPDLLATPAALRFVSIEPMLGPIDLENIRGISGTVFNAMEAWRPRRIGGAKIEYGESTPRLDWIIAGDESGPKRRPADPSWHRSIRDQCAAAGVAFFDKQREVGGKIVKLAPLDGAIHNAFPEPRA